MAANDTALLDGILAGRTGPLAEGSPDVVFELFVFEQILKSFDLTDDELLYGQVGGGNDGGLDGLFTFLDDNLAGEDADFLQPTFDPTSIKRGVELTLFAIQAKVTPGFGETAYRESHGDLRRPARSRTNSRGYARLVLGRSRGTRTNIQVRIDRAREPPPQGSRDIRLRDKGGDWRR